MLWARSSSLSAWRTVSRGFSDEYGSWNTIWIRRRCARSRLAAIGSPANSTSPAVGW